MKSFHENNGAAIYVGKSRDRAANVHTTVEYLNRNVSIGQLPQHISKSIVVCARSRPKNKAKKHTTKKFVRFHSHCLFYYAVDVDTDINPFKPNP